MRIIGCDVGWTTQKSRNAIAVVTDKGQVVCLERGLDDDQLAGLVYRWAKPESLILLDVPIEGCKNLKGPRRPIENALQHYISLYPASRAGNRGEELKNKILKNMPANSRRSVAIKEIYPYAVYKFLWEAKKKGKLGGLVRSRKSQAILDRSFIPSSTPPKYKGSKVNLDQRFKGMNSLRRVITQDLGLKFSQPLDSPDKSYTRSKLEILADLYDACLGAVVGWHCAVGNPYAWLAGNDRQGEMLLLADEWLKERLEGYGVSLTRLY